MTKIITKTKKKKIKKFNNNIKIVGIVLFFLINLI